MKIDNFENQVRDAVEKCFLDIPFVGMVNIDIEPYPGDNIPDMLVAVRIRGEVQKIVAEINSNGEPRYARLATYKILRYLDRSNSDYGVFVAPYISPRAAAICQDEGIGYIDLAGNCHVSFDNIYIHKEGKANPFSKKRSLQSLFAPKAERILRVLLTSGTRVWKTEELAREADVSLGQVSNVKKLLSEQEWINTKAVGFSLSDPNSLLEEWSQNYKYRRNEIFLYYSMEEVAEFENKLAEVCQRMQIRYGLTGFSGSSRYAPAVRYQRVMAYVSKSFDELIEALAIKPVDSGENIRLFKPYDDGVFYGLKERDGAMVVSPVQVYLDLIGYRGRGEEAARVLLDQVIQKSW